MAEANLLEARHLTKITDRRKVVDEVSLKVNRGEIVGLLGRDRAAMTATLQMLTGTLKPDGGTVRILGDVLTAFPEATASPGPAILRLAGQGVGVLFAEHDVRGSLDFCDRAYVLGEGRVLASGPSSGLLAPQ